MTTMKSLKSLQRMLTIHLEKVNIMLLSDTDIKHQLDNLPKIDQKSREVKKRGSESKMKQRPTSTLGGKREMLLDFALESLNFRKEQVKVRVRVVFTKIGTVDTIHDRYSAEVLLQTKWREPELDGLRIDADELDWGEFWLPNLSISNGMYDLRYETMRKVLYDTDGSATVCEKRRTSGQFFQFMELNQFPFDSQDLTITVTSERDSHEFELVEDESESCGVDQSAFSSAQEWTLDDKVNVWQTTESRRSDDGQLLTYPKFRVSAKVSRRPQFFIWNIIVIMFTICCLAFSTFTVKMEAPESRLPLTFILVLTTVTFKFVVNKNLPRISYLTLLDKYILGCMIILSVVCVWHSLAGSLVYAITPDVTTPTITTPTVVQPTSIMVVSDVTAPYVSVASTSTSSPRADDSAKGCIVSPTKTATTMGKLIDRVAFGVLMTVYILFHVVFLVLIVCVINLEAVFVKSKDDHGPNEEVFTRETSRMSLTQYGSAPVYDPGYTYSMNQYHSLTHDDNVGRTNIVAAQLAIGGD